MRVPARLEASLCTAAASLRHDPAAALLAAVVEAARYVAEEPGHAVPEPAHAALEPAVPEPGQLDDAAALPPGATSLQAERTRGAVMNHREWVLADGARARLRWQWQQFFDAFDVVVCPVMPTPAYPHDHSPYQRERHILVDGTPYPYMDQLVWPGVATTPGLPATSVPIGLSHEGLPIGVQIVGPALEDRTPLAFASLLEREFGGFVPPPRFT